MTTNIYSDSWQIGANSIPTRNTFLQAVRAHHPITLSILSQLSQDIYQASHIRGDSQTVNSLVRRFSTDGWKTYLIESVYQALLKGCSFLVLDFGDAVGVWETEPPINSNSISPYLITHGAIPTVASLQSGHHGFTSGDSQTIHPSRYIRFDSPYRFDLPKILDGELQRHDNITQGIENTVSGVGLVRAGIDNLYEIMLKGGRALSNLTDRLFNLKQATRGEGVLAYDLKRETVDVTIKGITREHEVLRIIENRISAITGLPSFVIWGHTDGDGYGVKTSLDLYSQRLTALSGQCLTDNLTYLVELLSDKGMVWGDGCDIYPEKPADTVDRFNKYVDGLATLQSIGAMNSIEVRDTVASDQSFGLVLNPSPTIVTTESTPPADAAFSG